MYDFRSISLCNVCYKSFPKFLINRLKMVSQTHPSRTMWFPCGQVPYWYRSYSLEQDSISLPRMMFKVDIEKGVCHLEWSTLLTLRKMEFPDISIAWISACLTSSSFAFLINGKLSGWIKTTRDVRQEDPISPCLFILVSQNFSNTMNFTLHQNCIPGFDAKLSVNFNDLLFADNMIIVTKASKTVARACILCLNNYKSLTRQCFNPSKSVVYFPSWCNKKLSKSINKILGVGIRTFPFKYLGGLLDSAWITTSTSLIELTELLQLGITIFSLILVRQFSSTAPF